jgi:hypothetical protein
MERPAVYLAGQAEKRGLIPRVPSPERLLADVEAWFQAEYADALRSTTSHKLPSGASELLVSLHPAAENVGFVAGDGGRVQVSAPSWPTGPGYHTFVSHALQRLGTELEITWAPLDAEDGSHDETGYFGSGDRAPLEQAHLAWLLTTLNMARDARRKGRTLHVGTPAGARFTFNGALASALGPRDDAWLERAVEDPATAIDILPWWADVTDGRYLLSRALCLMWSEVRWRPPAIDSERALLNETLTLLQRAFPLDPSLPFPWREWKELIDHRGFIDGAAEQIQERAAGENGNRPPIGYRRQPVTIVHEGWSLEIPGSFAERRTDEEWWGGEGGRGITLAGTETGTDDGPMSPESFLLQVASHLGSDALTHRDGELLGKARLNVDESSGVSTGVLEAYAAVTGRGAAMRVVFDDPDDWPWAMDVWRGLVPA